LAAAEVEETNFSSFTPDQRASRRAQFYRKFSTSSGGVFNFDTALSSPSSAALFAVVSPSRKDLMPAMAIDRLNTHNQLFGTQRADASEWMRSGLSVAARLKSAVRHLDAVIAACVGSSVDDSTDHLSCTIWSCMAAYHCSVVHAATNDAIDIEAAQCGCSHWVDDLAAFAGNNIGTLQAFARAAQDAHEAAAIKASGNKADAAWMLRQADAMQAKAALSGGLGNAQARQLYLFASWLTLAAADVVNAPFTDSAVESSRSHFYRQFVTEIGANTTSLSHLAAAVSAQARESASAVVASGDSALFAVPCASRFDLVPARAFALDLSSAALTEQIGAWSDTAALTSQSRVLRAPLESALNVISAPTSSDAAVGEVIAHAVRCFAVVYHAPAAEHAQRLKTLSDHSAHSHGSAIDVEEVRPNSGRWLDDLAAFCQSEVATLRMFARAAMEAEQHLQQTQTQLLLSGVTPAPTLLTGGDVAFFLNQADAQLTRAEMGGLKSEESRRLFLFASWLALAASEVDDRHLGKYTAQQRSAQRAAFYQLLLSGADQTPLDAQLESADGTLALAPAADLLRGEELIPPVALERLDVHHELSAVKFPHPTAWKRVGFSLAKRMTSLKRHLDAEIAVASSARDGALLGAVADDEWAHAVWNFMAIYHVAVQPELFGEKNDLVDFEALRAANQAKASA
jgi:hypothetical protein